MPPEPVLSFHSVDKIYPGSPPVRALDGIELAVPRGVLAAVLGPSGSGKTTLLQLGAGLDRPTRGEVHIAGRSLAGLSRRELCRLRARSVGFIFQAYNLFPVLSAVENVEWTALVRGDAPGPSRERALRALDSVGLADRARALPAELSGGQQQRVAVARALASAPEIVFADEPTANLDSTTARQLIDLFERLSAESGLTFLFATHDPQLVERVHLRIAMRDGRIVGEGGASAG